MYVVIIIWNNIPVLQNKFIGVNFIIKKSMFFVTFRCIYLYLEKKPLIQSPDTTESFVNVFVFIYIYTL